MNKLTTSKRAEIIRCLVEGNSIRSTVRITGAAKNTVTKLLVDAGRACSAYQNEHLRNLPCRRIQVDEIWAFVHAKAKNVPTAKAAPEGAGDIWTWTAICADTKLVPCWVVGARDTEYAFAFIDDLRSAWRTASSSPATATSPTLKPSRKPLAMMSTTPCSRSSMARRQRLRRRYSPAKCIGTKREAITGNPDPDARLAPATSSARTSRCGWPCAALRG